MQNSLQKPSFIEKQQAHLNVPMEYKLYTNFPQTFYKVTRIAFDIPVSAPVKLDIYDVFGRNIENLLNCELRAGSFEVKWNAYNFPAGVYYYKVTAGDFTDSGKMFFMKK